MTRDVSTDKQIDILAYISLLKAVEIAFKVSTDIMVMLIYLLAAYLLTSHEHIYYAHLSTHPHSYLSTYLLIYLLIYHVCSPHSGHLSRLPLVSQLKAMDGSSGQIDMTTVTS